MAMTMRRWTYLLFAAVLLTSCQQDEPTYGVDFSAMPTNGKVFLPYSEQEHDVEQEAPWRPLEEAAAAMAEWERQVADSLSDTMAVQPMAIHGRQQASSINSTDLARAVIGSLCSRSVHQVCGTYMSTDAMYNDIRVSGAVFYPTKGRIRNIIICSHYTVAANYEVPTQTFPLEAAFAALGYVVVMPDYIGYGETADRVHPYLQAYVTAANVIDMALAVRPFLAQRGIKVESDEVIIMGYSQGGATSLFVQYCMENVERYQGKFRIKRNYCGSGPYDVARTYDMSVRQDYTPIPYAVPMIILGMSEGMSNPLPFDQFFQEPLKSHYQEWFNSKRYSGVQLSQLIGSKRLSCILTPMGMDRSQPQTQRLYRQLIMNSIPSRYIPQAPIYLFHSMDDPTVPFINSQTVCRNFKEVGFTDYTCNFGHYGNHVEGCMKFMITMFHKLR